jgi:copper(I)-binding protein
MPDRTRSGSGIAGLACLAAGLVVAASALAGCAQQKAVATIPIKVASAYVMKATGIKAVAAYLVIANSGPADKLVEVHSSAGGKVLMLGPHSAVRPMTQLSIAGHGLTRLDPTGRHLVIVNPGPIREGTDITLTLVFAHAQPLKVLAQVNNPQTPSTGYFGP